MEKCGSGNSIMPRQVAIRSLLDVLNCRLAPALLVALLLGRCYSRRGLHNRPGFVIVRNKKSKTVTRPSE